MKAEKPRRQDTIPKTINAYSFAADQPPVAVAKA